jgi:hypothetical protein
MNQQQFAVLLNQLNDLPASAVDLLEVMAARSEEELSRAELAALFDKDQLSGAQNKSLAMLVELGYVTEYQSSLVQKNGFPLDRRGRVQWRGNVHLFAKRSTFQINGEVAEVMNRLASAKANAPVLGRQRGSFMKSLLNWFMS